MDDLSRSSAKNYKPNGDTMIIGGVLNVVDGGQIQKDGVPIDLEEGGGVSQSDFNALVARVEALEGAGG